MDCGQTDSCYTDSGSKDAAKGNAAYRNAAKRNEIVTMYRMFGPGNKMEEGIQRYNL